MATPTRGLAACKMRCKSGDFRPGWLVAFAAMTGQLISIRERLLDAADLVVDFATLGEYGIEPDPALDCERRPSGLASGAPHPLHDRAGQPERLAA
jgi:hypothetical protein